MGLINTIEVDYRAIKERKITMRRVMLVEPEHFVLQKVPIPEPGPAEVILKVERVGICGSDVHIYHGLSPRTRPPLVLGHEFSGTIHSIGAEVIDLSRRPSHRRTGDRVRPVYLLPVWKVQSLPRTVCHWLAARSRWRVRRLCAGA